VSSSARHVWGVGDGGTTKTLWLGCLFVSCVTVSQGCGEENSLSLSVVWVRRGQETWRRKTRETKPNDR